MKNTLLQLQDAENNARLLFKAIEEDEALVKYLVEYFRKMISNEV